MARRGSEESGLVEKKRKKRSEGGPCCKVEEASSVAGKALPEVSLKHTEERPYAIVLFYQYCEPAWSKEEHSRVLREMLRMGKELKITGRGRVAAEGVNCTLTGESLQVRKYCQGLREAFAIFRENCDFKITDGLTRKQVFKALTLRKTEELVGYGLATNAPSLTRSKAAHLEAHEYQKVLEDPGACVIDVRNAFETEIGRIVPPKGGAEFIDPMIRNSHEFPRWLALPETQKKLAGKTVAMYCTGGIRCERASALLDTMSCPNAEAASWLAGVPGPSKIVMVRGGIERYLRTFPDGGYWRGANYLFDRRLEQRPESQTHMTTPLGTCANCSKPCDEYRGRYMCAAPDCDGKVPVIVCQSCRGLSPQHFASQLRCALCRIGYKGAAGLPLPACVRASSSSRQAPDDADDDDADDAGAGAAGAGAAGVRKKTPSQARVRKRRKTHTTPDPNSRHLFVGNIPFATDRDQLVAALGLQDAGVFWLADRATKLFYGSAVVDARAPSNAAAVLAAKPALQKRALRVGYYQPNRPPTSFFAVGFRPPVDRTSRRSLPP